MKQNQLVELALQSDEFKNNTLDQTALAKIAGFTAEEMEFIKIFWNPSFYEGWIYINKEMVVEWLGYKESKNTMNDFHIKLIKDYESNNDFKEVNKNDDVVVKTYSENSQNEKLGNRAKYYLVSGECLKTLLMSAQTDRGKVVRNIYIKIEKLVFVMIEINNQQKLIIKDLEIQNQKNILNIKDKLLLEATNSNLKLDNKILNIKPYEQNGWIYLITNDTWAKSNVFRLGKTTDLDKRIGKYKIGRLIEEKLYYVFFYETKDVDTLESLLRSNLSKYREDPKTDQYILHWSILHPLVQNICIIFNNTIMTSINKSIENNVNICVEPEVPIKLIYDKRLTYFTEITENLILQDTTSSNEQTEFIFKEENLMSADDISNQPNEYSRNKNIKRNAFISKMHLLNFRVISPYYTTEHNITLMCIKDHSFDIIPNNHILDSVVCQICENQVKTNEATKLVSDRNIICLNYKEKRFKCASGHEFISSNLNYMLHRNGGCTECNKRTRLSKQDYHNVATSNNGKWIDENLDVLEAPSSKFPTLWQCAQKHEFTTKYQRAHTNWNSQCLECKSGETTVNYNKRITDIIKEYKTAELVTQKILGPNDIITFKCNHIPLGWSVMMRGFLLNFTWKCNSCKIETQQKIIMPIIDKIDNTYYHPIMLVINKYNAQLLTPVGELKSYNSSIAIKCAHKSWTTQIKSILIHGTWNCQTCKKIYNSS